MSIPLSIFLVIYGLAVAMMLIYALFNLYHILRFGHFDRASYFMTGLFIAGFLFILFVSYLYIRQVDFTDEIDLFEKSNFRSAPNTEF
jgi:hypothetical protein